MEITINKKENDRKRLGRPKGQPASNAGEKPSTRIERDKTMEAFEANLNLIDRLLYEGLDERKITKSLRAKAGRSIPESLIRERKRKLQL